MRFRHGVAGALPMVKAMKAAVAAARAPTAMKKAMKAKKLLRKGEHPVDQGGLVAPEHGRVGPGVAVGDLGGQPSCKALQAMK